MKGVLQMKGNDILNETYDIDKEKFRKHLLFTKEQIKVCADSIEKFKNKKKKYEDELVKLKKLTLREWLKSHK
jgi:hypothetical protein